MRRMYSNLGSFVVHYMPISTGRLLTENATQYWEKRNMPNYVGSIDRKHVRIKCPKGYESLLQLQTVLL
jgi:hypothetical protein